MRDSDPSILIGEIGYEFANRELLKVALTHRSYAATNNERLEFLGDAVLNCQIAELLFVRFGSLPEGELSRLRARLVRQETLAKIARRIDLGKYLKLGEGERRAGGADRDSILADALEAVIGAIARDGGYDSAGATVSRLYEGEWQSIDPADATKDPKTRLQELMQGRRLALPEYRLEAVRGAAHEQEFEVECAVVALGIACRGTGSSRRSAEQKAASAVLAALHQ